jgi:queuine tRNA-ribosyltransferase
VAYTRYGKLNLKNARHADDPRPLDEAAPWAPARDYSRAYLHHLVKSDEILASMLLSWNNVAYYEQLMARTRRAIEMGCLDEFVAERKEEWARGDIPPRS